jgi:MipA family protein
MHIKNAFCLPLLMGLLCTIACLQSARAAEDDGAEDQSDTPRWGLGLGVSTKRSPYLGVKNDTSVIPLLSYENRYVRFFGNALDVKLPSAGEFDFALRSKFAFGEGYKGSDSVFLNGMEDRKGSLYLGAAAIWRGPYAKISLEALRATGNSKGSRVKLDVEHAFRFDRRFELTPHLGAEVVDSKYVDYYFGVKATEATLSRPQFAGRRTTLVEGGVRLGYVIDRNQRLLLDVTDTHWGSGITRSPLVQRSSTPGLRIGYLYGF